MPAITILIAPIRLRSTNQSCQYAYECDPVAGITLPPERPRRRYRTTTYTDNNRADMPTIYEPDNRRTDMPAT